MFTVLYKSTKQTQHMDVQENSMQMGMEWNGTEQTARSSPVQFPFFLKRAPCNGCSTTVQWTRNRNFLLTPTVHVHVHVRVEWSEHSNQYTCMACVVVDARLYFFVSLSLPSLPPPLLPPSSPRYSRTLSPPPPPPPPPPSSPRCSRT